MTGTCNGTLCQVTLLLGEPQNQLTIKAKDRRVRVDDSGMGIEITDILRESFDHMRNLVMYNLAGDTEKVEKEFKSHLGLKRRK